MNAAASKTAPPVTRSVIQQLRHDMSLVDLTISDAAAALGVNRVHLSAMLNIRKPMKPVYRYALQWLIRERFDGVCHSGTG